MAGPTIPFASAYAALPTPFDDRNRIDKKALDHLLEYLLSRDLPGVALLTEAAEDPLLLPDERRTIVEIAARRVAGKKGILVAVSTPATREAVDTVRWLETQGVTGVIVAPLLVPGFGYRALYRHIDKIGRATKLPIFLAVRPANSISLLAPEEMVTLAKHESVRGVFLPEATPTETQDWARRFKGRDGDVISGCALSFAQAARQGATSAVCGVAILAVEQVSRLLRAVQGGDVDAIRRLEKEVAPAVELLGPPKSTEELEGLKKLAQKLAKRALGGSGLKPSVPFALVKEALRLQGHPIQSFVRPPYEQVGSDQTERLRAVLKSSGLMS